MTSSCVLFLPEGAAGGAAGTVAQDPPAGPEGEQDDLGQHQHQSAPTQRLPLPLPAEGRRVRRHHDPGEASTPQPLQARCSRVSVGEGW